MIVILAKTNSVCSSVTLPIESDAYEYSLPMHPFIGQTGSKHIVTCDIFILKHNDNQYGDTVFLIGI